MNNNALEREIREPIRPQVIRPAGLALTDPETIKAANAEMLHLEAEEIEAAQLKKLQLLLGRYSLADDDWYGLARALAIQHEPGFQVESQLAVVDTGFSGPVIIGDKTAGRPAEWTWDRRERLLTEVEQVKTRDGLTNDNEALERIIGKGDWKRPNRSDSRDSWRKTLQNHLAEARAIRRRIDDAREQLNQVMRKLNEE